MRWHWSTVSADALAEVEAETLGNTWGAAQPPVDAVAASRGEEDVQTLGDTLSGAKALVDTLADKLAEVEAETLGDTRGDAEALVQMVARPVRLDQCLRIAQCVAIPSLPPNLLASQQACRTVPAHRQVYHLLSTPPPLLSCQRAT